jgi:hypothetical protein
MEDFQLIPIQDIDAVSVFTNGGLNTVLSSIKEQVLSFVPDVSTASGRKEIASIAYKVSQSKTYLDNLGKDLVSDWKNKAKIVDSERKKARDFLDNLKAEVRQPLTDYEAAEEARIQKHEKNLQYMDVLAQTINSSGEPLSVTALKSQMDELESIEIGDHWEEFASKAKATKARCVSTLAAAIARQEKAEAEAAELDRLRKELAEGEAREQAERTDREQKEREERIAKEAAERAIKEAEAKAERERLAAENRERELKEAAERAERQRIEAEARAKAEQEAAIKEAERKAKEEAERKERERLAKEAADKAEAERLAANKRHREKIHGEAVADLKAKLTDIPLVAEAIIEVIAKGEIRNVFIRY